MAFNRRGFSCVLSVVLAMFSGFGYAQQKGPVRLTISPANPPLAVGNNLSFSFQETFLGGAVHGGGARSGVTARWTSDTPSVVSIDPVSGLATANASGAATITLVSGPVHASTVVNVPTAALTSISISPLTPSVPKGLPQQFIATAHYADSSTLDATSVAAWSSSDLTAKIDATGLAQTLNQGTPTIQAQYGGFSASTVLTIGPAALVSIMVTPNNPSVAKGLSQQFTATGVYTDHSTQDLTSTATWSSTATAVATINAGGLAQTLTQGSTTINALSSAVNGSTSLTVGPPALVSIVIGGGSTVHLPHPTAFGALGTYTDGSIQDFTSTATWSSSNTAVATMGSTGIASTLAAGPTTITATGPNNIQGTLSLTVTAPLVPRFAYVSAPDAKSLSYYVVDPVTSQLRIRGYLLLGGSYFGLVADPLGRFVYATSPTSIQEFVVNSDGTLSLTGSLVVSLGGAGYQGPTIDPAGKFLYAAASGNNGVAGFAINPATGALTAVPGSPFAGGGTATGPIVIDGTDRFLYAANLTSNNISGYSINSSTGALTSLGAPRATVQQPGLTIDSLGRRLYLQGFSSSTIDAFSIDPGTGALTRLAGAPFTSINNNRGATFLLDPAEKFGYITTNPVGSGSNTGLALFSVDLNSGALTQLNGGSPFPNVPEVDFIGSSGKFAYATPPAGSPVLVSNFPSSNGIPSQTSQMLAQSSFNHVFALVEGAQGVSVTPKYVYATNQQDNTVSAFSMNPATGALTGGIAGSPFATGTAPASISVDPSGSFAFVANSTSNNVSAYTISNTGALTAVAGSPFPSGHNPTSVYADISGSLLYVANTNDDNVSGYSINRSNGVLSALFNSPYTALLAPSAVVTDPTGSYAFVSSAVPSPSNQLLNYNIDVSGSSSGHVGVLQNNSSGQAPAGVNPQGIAVLPSGAAVYVASKGSNAIFAFQSSTCVACVSQPQPLGSFPAHTQPVAVAVDPKGRFLYAANLGSNDISIYSINPDFTLTPFPGGPMGTGTGPNSLAVDPSGNFLLVADSGSNDISVFSINQATGALAAVSGSPFATGTKPVSLTVTGVVQ
jgi:6-phosphogluconolactonase (cycloisomerase 2 family)